MKLAKLTLLFLVAFSLSLLSAKGWEVDSDILINLTQGIYSDNWSGSEQSTVTWVAQSNTTAQKQMKEWLNNKNTLKLAFGQTHQEKGDIDGKVFPGIQGGPLMHAIAGKAAAFHEALQPSFKAYQQKVIDNAQALAKALVEGGFKLVSGGTDTHLMLLNMGTEEEGGPSGKKMEEALDMAGITANKNTVPFDTRSPFVASGVRLGTPSVTTRGMGEAEMKLIASFIKRVRDNYKDEEYLAAMKAEVRNLTDKFPLYPEL
jgi:glycine hydroxymethyltransferase